MQTGDNEHVIRRRFLECRYYVRIDEASIAEKHRPQHGRALRLAGKEAIQARQHVPANTGETL